MIGDINQFPMPDYENWQPLTNEQFAYGWLTMTSLQSFSFMREVLRTLPLDFTNSEEDYCDEAIV